VEDKTAQPVGELTTSISEEIRQAHLNEWLSGVSKRFDPTVENVQFFTQPKLAVPVPATPSPVPAAK